MARIGLLDLPIYPAMKACNLRRALEVISRSDRLHDCLAVILRHDYDRQIQVGC